MADRSIDARFRFGQFEAALKDEKLFRRGIPVRMERQPFQVLAALLGSPGETVSREELRVILWPDGTYVDFDEGLNTAVKKLRSALNDSSDNPTFIETVPRRGYRFIAPITGDLSERLGLADSAAASRTAADFSEGSGRHTPGPTGKQSSTARKAIVAGIALVIVAGLAIVWAVQRRVQTRQEPVFSKLSFGSGTVTSARFSPDGQTLYYGAAWGGKPTQLFSTRLNGSDAQAYQIQGDILSISREGRLALLLDVQMPWYPERWGTLAVVPKNASSPRKLLDNVQDADFSPDGFSLLVAHWVGRHCRLEFPIGKVLYEREATWISSPRISPSGDQIAFLQHPLRHDDAGFVTVVGLGGNPLFVSPAFPGLQGLAWDPSGEFVWFTADEAGSRGERAIFQVRVGGKPQLIRRESSALTIDDVSGDGRVLVAREFVKAPAAGRISPEVKEKDLGWLDNALFTDISPDGSNVLFSVQREAAGQGYLAYIRGTGTDSPPTLLGEGQPIKISPDGRKVVVRYPAVSQPTSIAQFSLLQIGVGQPQSLTHDSISHAWATWLPDGRHLVFTGNEPGHALRTWLQGLDGGPAAPITPEGTEGHWVSGDGQLLAAADAEQNLLIYPLAGGRPHVVAKLEPDEEILCWSEDGRGIFVAKYALPADVRRIEIATGRRRLLFQLAPSDTAGVLAVGPVLITPDAKSYVYSYVRILSDLYVATGLK